MARIQTPQQHGSKWRVREPGTRAWVSFDTPGAAADYVLTQTRARRGAAKRLARRPGGGGQTIAEFREGWAPTREITPRTADTQEGYWRHYVEPYLGSTRLAALTTADVNSWLATLKALGASKDTRYGARSHLSAIYSALPTELALGNPVRGSQTITPDNRSIRSATTDEVELLLKAADDHYRLLWWFIADTGVRISEAIGLKIKELKLKGDAPSVEIMRVAERDGSTRETTKGGKGRKIPLTTELAAALATRTAGKSSGARVFTDEDGAALGYTLLRQNVFVPTVVRAGLVDEDDSLTIHDLRHHACTSWIEAGVPLPTVQRLMGHASIQTTERYAHPTDAGMEAARAARVR